MRKNHFSKTIHALLLIAGILLSLPMLAQQDSVKEQHLDSVIVSTGYQHLPRERATGSFGVIDSSLLNRTISTSLPARLDGSVPGLYLDKRTGLNTLSIRGQSSLLSSQSPLIILDNFPYDGDINAINPADIESITLLKDAAAASVWGARAGNGVLVITTKSGSSSKTAVNFTANFSVLPRPDVFKIPYLEPGAFIDLEQQLFDSGYYDFTLSNTFSNPVVSPVVALLNEVRKGQLTAADANAQIAAMKQHDVRDDFKKYLYGTGFNRQYNVQAGGGSGVNRYLMSLGYDNNTSNLSAGYKRYTVRLENNMVLKKLTWSLSAYLAETNTVSGNSDYTQVNGGYGKGLYPYAALADANGSPLALPRDYSNSFKQKAEDTGLLNWNYYPLQESALTRNRSSQQEVWLTTALEYHIAPGLSAKLAYLWQQEQMDGNTLYDKSSYFVRDLVNRYSAVDGSTITRPLPYGDIMDEDDHISVFQTARAQVDYNHTAGNGVVTALAGTEWRNVQGNGSTYRTYGYDNNVLTTTPVNYNTYYSQYGNPYFPATLPYINGFSGTLNRYVSYFANAAFTWKQRYTFSASGRKDASNLFGVNANQKGVPLWSAGILWNVSREAFYKSQALPLLKLRLTYGYSGNTNSTVSALTTLAYIGNSGLTNAPIAAVNTPPNPQLEWEKVKMVNAAVDFATAGNRFSGSLEWYIKNGEHLIGDAANDPTSGYTSNAFYYSFRGNVAATKGRGIDIQLNSLNLRNKVQWQTTLIASYNKTTVSHYEVTGDYTGSYITNGLAVSPLIGKPVYAVLTYAWAGLDPGTGDPQGYVDGKVSKDYATILYNTKPEELHYSGSALPLWYGTLRNTFGWKNWSLLIEVSAKFDYWFIRNGLNYGAMYSGWNTNKDYNNRWQHPGDEKHTNVPSAIIPDDYFRDQFYINSAALAEKGDHIRLQNITLSWQLKRKPGNPVFKQLQLYANANNVLIIWRANHEHLDPDYLSALPPATLISFGVKTTF